MFSDSVAPRLQTLAVSSTNSIVTVCLNRPDVHNAFNATVIKELTEVFQALAVDDTVRAVVLRGEGKSFCAGADANWMRASLSLTERENVADALRMSDMFGAIDSTPQPVIARVQGAALGGGMGLLAVCDIVITEPETRFGFTETRLGIIPAVISAFVVPKIGPSWARRYFLPGSRFDAEAARLMGLAHLIVPVEHLDQAVASEVDQILQAGPMAAREAKALIEGLKGRRPEQWREFTASSIARVRTSPEGQEGLHAFLEKRDPGWRDHSASGSA